MAGVELVHVPYKGNADAIGDLLSGRVSLMFSPASTVLPHVRSLATTQLKRASIAPELPTLSESGLRTSIRASGSA
jgi:tripartite-type tricarboxylate transporter receptor subunit TctC